MAVRYSLRTSIDELIGSIEKLSGISSVDSSDCDVPFELADVVKSASVESLMVDLRVEY